jgi:hypothetical protein
MRHYTPTPITCAETGELLAAVEEYYLFRNRHEVLQFLQKHSFLLPLLVEAYGKIAE